MTDFNNTSIDPDDWGVWRHLDGTAATDEEAANAIWGVNSDYNREELAILILRAADDEKPVWKAGLDEIVDAVLEFTHSKETA